VFISLITWNNLLKRFNPAEEPLYCTALFIEFWIKPDMASRVSAVSGISG
jgi:hypothetical protein